MDNATSRPSSTFAGTTNRSDAPGADTQADARLEPSAISQYREALQAAQEERKVLLREIDHRVKNNMQLVISLLTISAQQVKEANLQPVFLACRDRMNALSMIHETLYKSSTLKQVDFVRYATDLIAKLSGHYDLQHCHIRQNIQLIPLDLETDRLIDIGLVLSELIANVYQHAFPTKKEGALYVEMASFPENHVELVVSDNGIGMHAGDATTPNAFGLKFVGGIIERNFGGDMQIQHEAGTRVVMRFPAPLQPDPLQKDRGHGR